jgi:hypothetical protein
MTAYSPVFSEGYTDTLAMLRHAQALA